MIAAAVLGVGCLAFWYRAVYNVWPGQGASTRVHWCGRDYESFGGPSQTLRQITARETFPIVAVGQYPPLAWTRHELFAAATKAMLRQGGANSQVCAVVVYLRTGGDQYQPYSLEGGP